MFQALLELVLSCQLAERFRGSRNATADLVSRVPVPDFRNTFFSWCSQLACMLHFRVHKARGECQERTIFKQTAADISIENKNESFLWITKHIFCFIYSTYSSLCIFLFNHYFKINLVSSFFQKLVSLLKFSRLDWALT